MIVATHYGNYKKINMKALIITAKVVHCKKEKYDVYIGRGSKWGNPYTHKEGTTAKYIVDNREMAVQKYKEWITKGEGQHLLDDLHELKNKKLGCFCKPKSCHGDVLKELIERIFN